MGSGSAFSREWGSITTGGVLLAFISYERGSFRESLLRWRLDDLRRVIITITYERASFIDSRIVTYKTGGCFAEADCYKIFYLQDVVK